MVEPQANHSARLTRALRESAFTAAIAFGLFLPLIGFNTVQNIRNELILETRWPLLASLVAIIAAARFAQVLVISPWYERRRLAAPKQVAKTREHSLAGNLSAGVILAFAIIYPAIALWTAGFQGAAKWIDNFGVQILIYVMLGWGLNIVVGLAGLLDLGYVAFYAVGAYSYALLATSYGLSFWVLLPIA
jgi:branched-chain amino acid transport system permease protein